MIHQGNKLHSSLKNRVRGESTLYTYPVLFFAVERNSPELVSLLCKAGANLGDRAYPSCLPVLAYCVISAEYGLSDTTETLVALLAAGATSSDIPKDMWEEYIEAPKTSSPKEGRQNPKELWCNTEFRAALCRNLTLSQRYYLWKATLLPAIKGREQAISNAFRTQKLYQIPYHIVGQLPAANQVIKSVACHLLIPLTEPEPLALLFAGPSGHGKTELACRMGDLLNVKFLRVDCTEMQAETDMSGPKKPFAGYLLGSPLNNYLVRQDGSRSVVFLDEFDKTTDDVRKAMLIILESGYYMNRINGRQVDCRRTIWIMATNHGQYQIKRFWDEHLAGRSEEAQALTRFDVLQTSLKKAFTNEFGGPLTGRISSIFPLVPFNAYERAVVAYTFMRKYRNAVREDINVDAQKFVGHIDLHFVNDGEIGQYLASSANVAELGARELRSAVNHNNRDKLAAEYLDEDEPVKDGTNEDKALVKYTVCVVDGPEGTRSIAVKKTGSTLLQAREVEKEDLSMMSTGSN